MNSMRLNRNGCFELPDIYCYTCSGGTHSNMNKEHGGKGRCKWIDTVMEEGKPRYTSRCVDCGDKTMTREAKYFDDYAI